MSESKDYPHFIEVLLVLGMGSDTGISNLLKKRFRSFVGKTSIKKYFCDKLCYPPKNVEKNISTIY